jgi:hypothetical protein
LIETDQQGQPGRFIFNIHIPLAIILENYSKPPRSAINRNRYNKGRIEKSMNSQSIASKFIKKYKTVVIT